MEQLTVSVLPLLAAALLRAVPAPSPPAVPSLLSDTTVDVSRGDRLVLENFQGGVLVGVGETDVVTLRGRREGRGLFRVRRAGARLSVRVRDRRGRDGGGPFRVRVPPWLEVEVRGARTDAEIEGLRAAVEVRSLHGTVRLRDIRGDVEARTVHGRVVAEEIGGTVRLHTVDGDVRVQGAEGTLAVETVDGDVALERVEAEQLNARSMDGDVRLFGSLRTGSHYRLTTHDGDLQVSLARPVDADVTVSTFDGEFAADVPVTLERFRGGQEMRFTLGEGGAELVLEAFDGDIGLRRDGG